MMMMVMLIAQFGPVRPADPDPGTNELSFSLVEI
jgi:hypothetical protein